METLKSVIGDLVDNNIGIIEDNSVPFDYHVHLMNN